MTVRTGDIFFSVIIPTYNRAECIVATIESVLGQSYRLFEVIIVDDGSTDNTEALIQPYLGANFFYYRLEHGERSKARNFGTSKSKGDYINWFDSDDIMLPHHLEELKNAISRYDHPALVGVGYEIEEPGKGVKYRMKLPEPILNTHLIRRNNLMLTMTGIVRRDIAFKYPFNTAAIPREDYELWLRIAAGHSLYSTGVITVRVRAHEKSGSVINGKNTSLYRRGLESFFEVLDKNKDAYQLPDRQLRRLKTYLYTGAAYFLAVGSKKKEAIRLLGKAIAVHPAIFFQREFLATIKRILFTFQTK